jgi:hypothetical protein
MHSNTSGQDALDGREALVATILARRADVARELEFA